MKLLLAFMSSLIIHGLVTQWQPTVASETTGSAGRAVLNIQHMRFITASVEQLNEHEAGVEPKAELSESDEPTPVDEVVPVSTDSDAVMPSQTLNKEVVVDSVKPATRPVKQIEEEKKAAITQPEKKSKHKKQELPVEQKLATSIKKAEENKVDNSRKQYKKIVKQHTEKTAIKYNKKEKTVTNSDTESVDEKTEILAKTETDMTAEKQVEVDVISSTDSIAMNSGFDQIPTMEKPRYRKAFPPKYPRLAKKRGQQGLVLLRAKVDRQGEVEMVEVLQSSGVKSLDVRALETVEQWLFYPYTVANKPIVAWVNIPVDFTLR
ncbi:MAG: energy transducer TonB [Proteobacteria bacterium]|nr:energy transducer TonB [Pseudomonadota bacterium]